MANWLHETLGFIPFFGTSLSGPGLLPAALVLAIMILPTVAAISQDALHQIPYKVKEAAYGMGDDPLGGDPQGHAADRQRRHLQRLVLGFGRALGETMALAMLIGNANQISLSLFSPANTLASLLASNFPEAGGTERDGADVCGASCCWRSPSLVNIVGRPDPALRHPATGSELTMAASSLHRRPRGRPQPRPLAAPSARAVRSLLLTVGAWARRR